MRDLCESHIDNARKFLNKILIADHDSINSREIISVFDRIKKRIISISPARVKS